MNKKPKRYELIVIPTFSLGDAPDRRTLTESGLDDLQDYAENMDLGDLSDYEVTIKTQRKEVKP